MVRVTDPNLIPTEYKITYETFNQEACSEHFNIVCSNQWEPASNIKYSDEPEFPKSYTSQM